MTTRRSLRRGSGTARDYPRAVRLNRLLREIVADELERLDDERLPLLTITAVEVEPDLRHATVFYDCLDGEAGDEATLEALGEARWRLQAAIARQARTKRTPELGFRPDPAVRAGERIDDILRHMETGAPEPDRDRRGRSEAGSSADQAGER